EPNGQYTARCLYRDADGKSRLVERSRHSKAAAERALKEALRDRTPMDAMAEIKPDTKVRIVAEAWWDLYQLQDDRPPGSKSLAGHLLPAGCVRVLVAEHRGRLFPGFDVRGLVPVRSWSSESSAGAGGVGAGVADVARFTSGLHSADEDE